MTSGRRSTTGAAETAGIVAVGLLSALAIVGTWLAWTGHLRAPVLFPLWIGVTALLLWLGRPFTWRPAWRRVHAATVCAALGIGAVTALNVASSGAHVATDRDPGVYVVGARLLARTGEIHAPGYAGTPFATFPGISAGSSGFADVADGRQLDLIQSPGLSSLLATAQLAAGDRAMFALVPLIAGLGMAFFAALAMRIAGPWFGLVAAAALAASLAEAYIARDAFAEVPTQALCLGALWTMIVALRDGHRGRAALAGVAIGSAVALHFPAMTAVAGLVLAATLETALGSADDEGVRRVRCYAAACATALPVAAAGLVGLNHWNAPYAHAHRPFIRDFVVLILLLLLIWAITLLLRRGRRLPLADAARRWLGRLAAAGVGVAAVYAVAVRPSIERGRVPPDVYAAMASLQRAAGVAIEPSRSYAEQTMRWLGDYMGPVALAVGLAGVAYACVRAARPEAVELRVVLPLTVIATSVYTLQPSAFPDQPWVMRRFAPEVIPLLLAFGVWMLRELWQAGGRARPLLRLSVAAASVLLIVPPLLVLRPVARANAGHRNDDVVHALCHRIGPDAAVLVVGGTPTTRWYPETISAFCGVPTAAADQPDQAALRRLTAGWALRGRQLFLVASGSPALSRWGIPEAAAASLAVVNPHAAEIPIDRPPGRYRPRLFRLSYAAATPG